MDLLMNGAFIEWFMSHLTSNDFLVAGIFTGLIFVARGLPLKFYNFVKRQLTIEILITNEDSDYEDIVTFIESHRFKFFSRIYSKSSLNEKSCTLNIGYGISWFYYNSLGYINRQFKDSNHSNKLKEEITIVLFTRNANKLKDLIDKSIKHKFSEDTITVFNSFDDYWETYAQIPKRLLSTIWMPEKDKSLIIESIDKFLNNREWYIERGIPYKFGIFIEGEPGTGKSSLVRAICSYLNRDMYFLNQDSTTSKVLTRSISEFNIMSYSSDDFGNRKKRNKEGVIILEEIDTFNTIQNRNDESEMKTDKTSMSTILNVLDGALTPDGLIFIATTNYPEKIDTAIKRPGRFDLTIKIGLLNKTNLINMIASLYSIDKKVVEEDFTMYDKPVLSGAEVHSIFIKYPVYEDSKDELKRLIKSKI